jgi:L-asparaginase/Glu-tRNA(Gln) amidotransferase subunit D
MIHILLIFTGGTIGSTLQNDRIDTDGNSRYLLLEQFRAQAAYAGQVQFDAVSAANILSENLHPQFWQPLLETIQQTDLRSYDGIIVTHGTDTLAFSAALLAAYFREPPIPLVLVSSDRPLNDPQANGPGNFRAAVELIRQKMPAGVFVSYRNPGAEQQIHLAQRLLSCLPLSSDFVSTAPGAWLQYQHGEFITTAPFDRLKPFAKTLTPQFAPILLLRPYPGLNYCHIDPLPYAAVLHDLYHSGTACVTRQWGEQHSLCEFSRRCRDLGKPLYLAPACRNEHFYASTQELLDNGVQVIWDTTLECAYAQLSIGYGNRLTASELRQFLDLEL